jgi:hypothetical protein
MHKSTSVMLRYLIIGVLFASVIVGFLVIAPHPWSNQVKINFWVSIAICLFNTLFLIGIPSTSTFELMIPRLGILWVFDVIYSLLALLCMLLFSIKFLGILFRIQILIQAILFAVFFSLGLWLSSAASDQVRKVADLQTFNIRFREARATFSQLSAQIQETTNQPELAQRIQDDCEEFSHIAPSNTAQAAELLDIVVQAVTFLTAYWDKEGVELHPTMKQLETAIRRLRVTYAQ